MNSSSPCPDKFDKHKYGVISELKTYNKNKGGQGIFYKKKCFILLF
jgi:hypothetical protein